SSASARFRSNHIARRNSRSTCGSASRSNVDQPSSFLTEIMPSVGRRYPVTGFIARSAAAVLPRVHPPVRLSAPPRGVAGRVRPAPRRRSRRGVRVALPRRRTHRRSRTSTGPGARQTRPSSPAPPLRAPSRSEEALRARLLDLVLPRAAPRVRLSPLPPLGARLRDNLDRLHGQRGLRAHRDGAGDRHFPANIFL